MLQGQYFGIVGARFQVLVTDSDNLDNSTAFDSRLIDRLLDDLWLILSGDSDNPTVLFIRLLTQSWFLVIGIIRALDLLRTACPLCRPSAEHLLSIDSTVVQICRLHQRHLAAG